MGCSGFLEFTGFTRLIGHAVCRGLEGISILGGSWDLVSKVISTLIGVISIVTLIITLVTKSHDPLSRVYNQGSKALEGLGVRMAWEG